MTEIKQRLLNTRDWLSLIEELEAEADQIDDREQRSKRLYVVGQACEKLFLRKDRAMVNYQKAFKLHPHDARPLVRARQIYREMGNLKMVAKLMDFQLKVVTDDAERAQLLVELAMTYVDLGILDLAKENINDAHALDPYARGLDEALATVSYDPAGWKRVVAALQTQAENLVTQGTAHPVRDTAQGADAGDEEKQDDEREQAAQLLVRASRIRRLQQPENVAACEPMLLRAAELDPNNEDAAFFLAALLQDEGREGDIADLHQQRIELTGQRERGALYRRLGSLWAIRFNDSQRTAAYYYRALHTFYTEGTDDPFPGHLAAFRYLRDTPPAGSDWDTLLRLAEHGLQAPLLEDDLAILALQAGEVAWRELGDASRAARYFSGVHRHDPENPFVNEFLAEFPDQRAVVESDELPQDARGPASDEQQGTDFYSDSESTRVAPKGEMDELVATAHEEPSSTEVPDADADVHTADDEETANVGIPTDLAREADDEPHDTDDEHRDEQLAGEEEPAESDADDRDDIESERSDDDERDEGAAQPTVDTDIGDYEVDESVTEEESTEIAAARVAEQKAPERGIEAWRKVARKYAHLRTPRRALARLYSGAQRWNQLADTLKEEANLIDDPSGKRDVLLRLADIYDQQLKQPLNVVRVLGQLLESDPTDIAVLDQLVAQYETMNRPTDLINTLRKKAEVVVDSDDKISIYVRVAQIYLDRSNQAEAIKAFEHVLELSPGHEEAIRQLKQMYERRRDWEKLVNVSRHEIDQLQSDEERGAAYLEVARLASSKLKKPAVSLELWNRVLDFDDSNIKALAELEKLHERNKDWERLAEVCRRQSDLIDDPDRKAQLLQKLGLLLTDKLKDEEQAIGAWRGLLSIEPDNRRAQDALKKLYLAARNYEELESFYASQGKWDEFIRVLERQVESEEGDTKLGLYFKIAGLWSEKQNKPERSIRTYDKILALDPRNREAAEALVPLLAEGRDARKYAEVLEIQLEHTDDPELKLDRLKVLAELYQERLRDLPRAFELYLEALAVDPRQEWPRENSERLAGETNAWPALVDAYTSAYENVTDPIDRLPLMTTVAAAYEREMGDSHQALETNKGILELEPQNEQALAALERLYLATQQYDALLDVYQRKIDLLEDPEERTEVYFRIAAIYEEELGNSDQAIEAYRTVLDLTGDNERALQSLDHIYLGQSRWQDLGETILRRLALLDPEDADTAVQLKYRLAGLRETELDDVRGALEVYSEILELDPEHEGTREALERRLADPEHQLESANLLVPVYERAEAWQKLVEAYEVQLQKEERSEARVQLLLKIAKLWVERIGDGERAFSAYGRCFKEDPSNDVAQTELERLATIQGRFDELATLYESSTEMALDGPLQYRLLVKLAQISDEKLDQQDRAVGFFIRAQEQEPDSSETLDALEKLYTRGEKWSPLVEILRRKAELCEEPEQRLAFLERIASIYEDMLENPEEAISTYNDILGFDDSNRNALKALDRLYQSQGNWNELGDNLNRQLTLADDADHVVALLLRVAELQESQLSQGEAAVRSYHQVLEHDPGNRYAVAALERLLEQDEHQQAVAAILEPHYRADNNWHRLVGVYEIMAKHADEPAQKVKLLHQIAELHEVAGDNTQEAFDVYARSLNETPGDVETQSKIESLARQVDGGWQRLVNVYQGLLPDVLDESQAVALQTKIARVQEEHLGDLEASAASFNQVLAIDGHNIAAVNALEQIYIRSQAHDELVMVLVRKAEMVEDVADRKVLLLRAAQIYEEVLEKHDDAVNVYQQVLDIDESSTEAVDAMERLFTALHRWEDLKEIYLRKVELTDDPEQKKEIYYALGEIYRDRLDDPERAVETYQAVVDLDADDMPAIRALDHLYRQSSRWYDLLQVLERQVELADDQASATDVKYRIGRLWVDELGDLTRAVETFREVLEVNAAHEPTLEALATIAHGEDEPVLAAEVLEPIYERGLEWNKLTELYEVMVKRVDDPQRKQSLLHKIADHSEHQLYDEAAAFDAYGRAFASNTDNRDAIDNLERLAAKSGNWQQLVALYQENLEQVVDPQQQIDVGLRIARTYEEQLGDIDASIQHYRRLLDVDHEHRTSLDSLDRLYRQSGNYTDLAEILRRKISLAEGEGEVVDIRFRLGQLQQEQLGDTTAAIESYREILADAPGHTASVTTLELLFEDGQHQLEIAEILEPLYRSGEQWAKLVRIMEAQLGAIDDDMDKVPAVQQIAELCEQKLDDSDRAFQWWAYGLQFDPGSELIGENLERLALANDSWEQLAGTYANVAGHNEGEQRAFLLKKMGDVFEEKLHDATRAEESYLHVLQIDAADVDALRALDRIYTAGGAHEELAEILHRRLVVTDDADELVALQLRLAQTVGEQLGDQERAIEVYCRVLDTDTRNESALEALERAYFASEQWQNLYAIYEKMIDVVSDDDGVAECYARMAKIASDALGSVDRAQDLWNRVLDIRGEDGTALSELASIYERREEWRDLVDVLQRQVDASNDDARRVALYERLGSTWGEKLGSERNALDNWQRVLEIAPENVTGLYAIAEIYRNTQAWEELVQTLHRLIDIGASTGMESDDLVRLHAQVGELQGEVLLNSQPAIEAWLKVLDHRPGDFRALNALEQLFTQEGRWEECIGVLQRKSVALESAEDKIDVLLQAAHLWEERLENSPAAAEVYEQIRALSPMHETTFQALDRIYRENESWDNLIDVLLGRADGLESTEDVVAVLHQVATIYDERNGDQEAAFTVLQAAFERDYSNTKTVKQLERLAQATGKQNELIAECNTAIQNVQDNQTKAELLVNLGFWYSGLSHPEYAIQALQQALKITPENTRALDALAELHRKSGQWAELVQVINLNQELEQEPQKRVELLRQMGEIYELQLADQTQAVTAYRKALEIDPTNGSVLDSLERLYRDFQQWDGLVAVLGRKTELTDDTDAVIALKSRIADIYEEQLDNATKAIECQKDVLMLEPHTLGALQSLERLYQKTGRAEDYLDILERQQDVVGTDSERIKIYERMAGAWEEQFGKLDRAAECTEKILLIDDRNVAAYAELERLYQQDNRPADLVETLRRHIDATSDQDRRVELYLSMGKVYESSLEDKDRAIEAFRDVLSLEPDHVHALDALARLYHEIEDWENAVATLDRLGELVDDTSYRVGVLHRLGVINREQRQDLDSAEQKFAKALEYDAEHIPSVLQLVEIYKARGDWAKAATMLVRAEQYSTNELEKTGLLYEAGAVYQNYLDDSDKAAELYQRTLTIDPDHLEAGKPLAEYYFAKERYDEAAPVFDMLVRKADREQDPSVLHQLYYQAARTADAQGEAEKALKLYQSAYDIDSTDLATLKGLADLLHKTEQWDRSFKYYQTILVNHRDGQDPTEIVDTYFRLGSIKLKLGEQRKALNMFEKAREVDPIHRPTLEAIVRLQEEQGDWKAVVEAKRAMLEGSEDADERFALHRDIGDVYAERLNDAPKALEAYDNAVELRADSFDVLTKQVELYSKSEQWKRAVQSILRLAELYDDSGAKARYYYAAAVIFRDSIRSLDEAIRYFDMSLDEQFKVVDPSSKVEVSQLKAFEAMDKIYTAAKDWKQQERSYRKMIKRASDSGQRELQAMLCHALGEVYRSRLRDYKSSIAAFEMAIQLDPDNVARQKILAELYLVAGDDFTDKAIATHQSLIKATPNRFDSYKALHKLYMQAKQYDKAWCVCATLALLGKADAEQRQFYDQYRQRELVRAQARLTDELWRKHIFHADEDVYVSTIFGLVAPAVGAMTAQAHRKFGLKRKERVQEAQQKVLFVKVFNYVTSVLNVAPPELYLRQEQASGLMFAHTTQSPSFVVGKELLHGRPQKELAFVIGQQLAFMRPEHFLNLALSATSLLRQVFFTALRMCAPQFPVPAEDAAAVDKYVADVRKRMHPAQLEQLNGVVKKFLARQPEIDLKKWSVGVQLTANRVGLILCNDLEVAANRLSTEPTGVGGLSPKDKVKELALYSVSEEYFGVRKQLGLAIGT